VSDDHVIIVVVPLLLYWWCCHGNAERSFYLLITPSVDVWKTHKPQVLRGIQKDHSLNLFIFKEIV